MEHVMGRKGTSKQKSKQTKTKNMGDNNPSGSVSSLMQGTESQPLKSRDTSKSSSDRKKGSRKE
jgi:hypothetical protein